MYKITFEEQPRHGEPDYEGPTITLTEEQYQHLPELSADIFNEKCEFSKGLFYEQVRRPTQSFPAVWISSDEWKLDEATEGSGGYMDDSIKWVFVCLDIDNDIWIAFEYYNLATVAEAYGSTVGVSLPCHGDLYRLDSSCKDIVLKFYN